MKARNLDLTLMMLGIGNVELNWVTQNGFGVVGIRKMPAEMTERSGNCGSSGGIVSILKNSRNA